MTSLRRQLLAELYGPETDELADRLDALVVATRRAPSTPRWSERDAWLISYPDQFGPAGLRGVAEVARALAPAINGVHVLPFHPSSGDGGFSVEDYAVVDPAVGSWADVAALAGDTRLMADAVINHVSARSSWFRSHLEGSPAFADFFVVVPDGTDLAAVTRPRPGAAVTNFARADGSRADYWTTFSSDQVDLDYRNPEVLLAVCEAIFRLVANGAVAVRLDAVGFLWKDPGTSSMHLPQTHALVALVRDCLEEIDPGAVLITETNVPHVDNVAYFGSAERPEAHAIYQFTLAPLVLHAVQTGETDPLVRWASSHVPRAGTTVLNFLASHDGVGLRPASGWLQAEEIDALAERCVESGGRVNRAATAHGREPYELAATWRSLCAVGVGGPFTDHELADRVVACHAVALSLAGIPLLYVHSLAASPSATERAESTGVARDLNRGRFATPADYLAGLGDDPVAGRVWPRLRAMLGWRHQSDAFHPEATQEVLPAPPGLVAIRRGVPGDEALVVTSLSSQPLSASVGAGWVRFADDCESAEVVRIDPWDTLWLRSAPDRPVVSAT